MQITFPHLGIDLPFVPKSFTVFGLEIALYGLIITCGMVLAVMLCARIADREGLQGDEIWSLSVWCIIACLIGARLYYVAFTWDAYKDNLLEILNLRAGGLGFYGGLIAAAATLLLYVRHKKLSFLQYADVIVYGILLGQIMGRWGNFTNREAFGGYTDNLFAMRLPLSQVRMSDITPEIAAHVEAGTNYIQVHPTFLYESVWNLCLLLFMLWYREKKRFDGERMLIYLGGYGFGRFLIEGLRTDQLLFPGTRTAVSQVLGAVLAVFSVLMILHIRYGRDGVKEVRAEEAEARERHEEKTGEEESA